MTLTPKPQPKSSFLQEESCSLNREHRRRRRHHHQHHGKKEHKRKKRRRENLHGGFLKGKQFITCKLQLRARYNNSKQGRENLCQITSSSVGSSRKKIRHLQQIIRLQQQQRRQKKLKKKEKRARSLAVQRVLHRLLKTPTMVVPIRGWMRQSLPFVSSSLSLFLSLPQTFKRSNVVYSRLWTLDTDGTPDFPLAWLLSIQC